MIGSRHLVVGALGVSLLVAALPGMALAQDDPAAAPFAAEGIEWMLTSFVDAEGLLTEVPEGVEATLSMDDGEANGLAGCNTFFGSYEMTEDAITFSPLGATMMFCEGESMLVEQAYLAALQAATGWSVADAQLTMTDANGIISLVFDEAPFVVTASDIAALQDELATMQEQIDALAAGYTAVVDADIPGELDAIEADVAKLQDQVGGVNVVKQKDRITANEEAIEANAAAITDLQKQMKNVKTRVGELETAVAVLDARVSDLEAAAPAAR